jgi:outer membrane lipoprotein-sorting protein
MPVDTPLRREAEEAHDAMRPSPRGRRAVAVRRSAAGRSGRPASDLVSRSALAVGGLLTLVLATGLGPPVAAAPSADQALDAFAGAWAQVQTYRCTITAHEVRGDQVQDRVYHMAFQKPHETRLEIVKGPGQGGVLVWHGGPDARGHRGGWLRFVNLTVGIHDPRATSLRGITIAQANFGFLLQHIRSLRTSSLVAKRHGGETEVDAVSADPASDQGITREVLVLGPSGLPVAYRQSEGDRVVRDVSYSDVELNVPIPKTDFEL